MGDLSVAEVLNKAADLIEPEGAWTQGTYARDHGGKALAGGDHPAACSRCMLGALEGVLGDHWSTGGAHVPLMHALEISVPIDCTLNAPRYIGAWNDAPERTQAEVVAKLREAAALASATIAHGKREDDRG